MDIGTTIPTGCTGASSVTPSAITEWATTAENEGFAGLWVLDHIVKPEPYATSFLNPFVALSYAAGVTDTIPLGTSILLLPLRGAANTADAALSLQYFGERGVTLGLGAGYVPEEFEVTGVPREERGPRLSEGIDVLQELFSGRGSYDGRFHDFSDITIDPVADDPPRILAGGSSMYSDGEMPEPVLDRIVHSDGWIAPPMDPKRAKDDWERIRSHAVSEGVDPAGLDRVALTYTHVVETNSREDAHDIQRDAFSEFFSPHRGFEYAEETCLVGSLDDIERRLDAYSDVGFDQVIAGPAAHETDALDEQMQLLSEHVLGVST